MDFSSKTCCVVDNGLFVEIAATLAESFGKVYLHVPWVNAYPKSNQIRVGDGLTGVTKVDAIWPILDKVDLWVFPDVYEGPLQQHLVSLGKRVWGSRMGEELELWRDFSKKVLADHGLAVGPYEVVRGMDKLRTYLKAHRDQYVKVSRSRGDFETFHSETFRLSEPRLDEIQRRLGALNGSIEFIVEEAIEDAVEVGYDGYTVDGRYPGSAMVGLEVKDKGYVGRFEPYADMPAQIREINDALSPVLAEYQYRNFWCAEARITKDGTAWVIDPCCRAGSPPSELLLLMYTNLAEIFWHGAAGELVDPVPAGKWGAQVMLISGWANENWQAIDFPEKHRANVKLHFPVVIDGRYYVTPQGFDLPAIGAVCAVGETMEEAVAEVKKIAAEVRGFYVEVPVTCFDDAEAEIAKLGAFGLEL
jgi:hypothetical protein